MTDHRAVFSKRTALVEEPNALSVAVAKARQDARFLDLTISNPTEAGLPYDADRIERAFAKTASDTLHYDPKPIGRLEARCTIATEVWAQHGVEILGNNVALTASTSEAYAVLFKMLCDPGDEILVPVPSYPLLAWLASFEGVTLKTYPLEYAGSWHVDLDALKRAITPRTRAIVVVSPNNPTGSFLGKNELDAMLDLDLPIISDEVFASYAFGPIREDRVSTALVATRGLVFVLSGLSKLAALPQMKLGWIVCAGAEKSVAAAMNRLEIVLDAYLSVGAPVQHAIGELLDAGKITSNAIRERTKTNLDVVRKAAKRASSAINVLDVEGGWYATLRVPETRTDEEWALRLVESDGVYVHPGYFFDMSRGAHLVVSLLTPEPNLARGMDLIAARIEAET